MYIVLHNVFITFLKILNDLQLFKTLFSFNLIIGDFALKPKSREFYLEGVSVYSLYRLLDRQRLQLWQTPWIAQAIFWPLFVVCGLRVRPSTCHTLKPCSVKLSQMLCNDDTLKTYWKYLKARLHWIHSLYYGFQQQSNVIILI